MSPSTLLEPIDDGHAVQSFTRIYSSFHQELFADANLTEQLYLLLIFYTSPRYLGDSRPDDIEIHHRSRRDRQVRRLSVAGRPP
jgi:hypothetical protein